jgi:hypothetical protein
MTSGNSKFERSKRENHNETQPDKTAQKKKKECNLNAQQKENLKCNLNIKAAEFKVRSLNPMEGTKNELISFGSLTTLETKNPENPSTEKLQMQPQYKSNNNETATTH